MKSSTPFIYGVKDLDITMETTIQRVTVSGMGTTMRTITTTRTTMQTKKREGWPYVSRAIREYSYREARGSMSHIEDMVIRLKSFATNDENLKEI